ncbi:SusC/RagA family TonB-linked outer membrane protein [Pedobacter sp.]|uniref:SusC/RagA family TonB-linked outer membrane protein n=1 Tax=Pedobacter sp. TaxID=1411316 RepID=UPI002B9AD1F1|nr:SusC/RagA family TonB-linked outer membrane protein [Pedobacter sp.]HWW41012.1 SusC/RagA family TonB-linked outer membrane protein [Pedobacter sp.]
MRINLIFILMTTMLLQVSAGGYAQRITLNSTNASLQEVFKEIRKQSGYDFVYTNPQVKMAKPVNIHVVKASLDEVLQACFADQPLAYFVEDKTIIIKIKVPQLVQKQQAEVNGIVLDEAGRPIAGASIRVKGNISRGTISNKDGRFRINASEHDIVVVSYIGYISQEIKFKAGQQELTVKLEIAENNMKNVVVTGTGITRNKNSFTGATASYTGEQLRAVSNQNIIQGLRALDPSFIQIENNQFGSNPNALPNIEIRGKTSISSSLQDQFASDPNQPLFILDGFETSLRTIVDLNQNRVASVTILKDAASTAMYGSKASNGVVVIETLKPRQGQMNLNYTSDFNIEMPDLKGYNMMNAAEKLEFERLSGRYTYFDGTSNAPIYQLDLDSLYNVHLAEVQRGVNTYWLNVPVQTGFSQRHSIYADGGDDALRYGVGLSYKKTTGAMKGSGRNDWAGNVDLSYRKGKFNFSNKLYISGYKADESPYGSFTNFVNANPYYRKDSPNERYLEVSGDNANKWYYVPNPLYNAGLNSINDTKNIAIQNNLQMIIDVSREFKVQGAIQVQKGSTTQINFLSPLNTAFDDTSIFEKGSYRNSRTNNFNYNGYLMLTYGKVFAGTHSLTANLRTEMRNDDNDNITFDAVGFPSSSNGNPGFAYSYKPNSKPLTALGKTRTNAILASANYAYKSRYLADFSYRYDGSTAFGANKKYSPYLSGGVGWNIHNEQFMKAIHWINVLKLYANMGTTGNQNFASVSSISTYGYDSYINLFGQGVTLNSLGNPDLKWQNSVQTSLGTDIVMFDNRFTINANVYQKKTDPLVVAVDLPSSTGIKSFPMNVGLLNTRGVEASIKYSPIYRPAERVLWTIGLTGTSYTSKYDGFNNKLASLNTKAQNSNSLTRYKDGYGPQDIWAVPSMGIDPGTGMEVFLKKDGQYTFIYDPNDIARVGSTQPKVEGVFTNMVSYKGFNFNLVIRYILGRDVFNDALYNKVENINVQGLVNNQDKRALYDRWKQPGDIAQFKSISLTTTTPKSSRFVQNENMLSGESVSFGYNFQGRKWLNRLGLSDLRVNGYMNDFFRVSTVQQERGIDYPFARSVSFSLNASF